MSRTISLTLSLLGIGLLALTGCGDQESLLGPSSAEVSSSAPRGGGETGLVSVVHGVPGLIVDVYVNGAKELDSFEPGAVAGPLELPAGSYDIVIVEEDGDPSEPAIQDTVELPAGANASIVAYLAVGGAPSLKTFVNDVSPTRGIRARAVVRHVADAPTVDVRLFRKWFRWWPARTIRGLSNPNEAQTDIFPGRLRAKIYPAGSRNAVYTTPLVPFRPNESTIVYAIGSLEGESFGVVVQKIDLPRVATVGADGVQTTTVLSA